MSRMMGRCSRCGGEFTLFCLDSKPRETLLLRTMRLLVGQWRMLEWAADRGYDFDVLECAACFGPGYQAIGPDLEDGP